MLLAVTLATGALAAPPVSEAFPTDYERETDRYGPYGIVAASDGERILTVLRHIDDNGVLWGSWVNLDGSPTNLPKVSLAVAAGDYAYTNSTLVFGGNRYLLCWGSFAWNSETSTYLEGRFIEKDGTLGDVFEISRNGENHEDLGIVWTGSEFVLAWAEDHIDPETDNDIKAIQIASLSPNGDLSLGQRIEDRWRPELTLHDGIPLVSWQEPDGAYLGRWLVDDAESPPFPVGVDSPLSHLNYGSALTHEGQTSFFWASEEEQEQYNINGLFFPDPAALGTITLDTIAGRWEPALESAYDGASRVIAWQPDTESGSSIEAVHVSLESQSLANAVELIQTDAIIEDKSLIWSGTNYVLIYNADGVYSRGFDRELTPLNPALPILLRPSTQWSPNSTWTGEHYLVAWPEVRSQVSSLRAVRITETGEVLDDPTLEIATGDVSRESLASAGEGTSVVAGLHSELPGIYTRAILSDGSFAEPIMIEGSNIIFLDIASNGSGYLLSYASADQLFFQALDLTGAPIGAADTYNTSVTRGRLEATNNGYLLLLDSSNHDPEAIDSIQVVPVSNDGVLGEPATLGNGTVGSFTTFHAASMAEQTLITWYTTSDPTLYGQFMEGGLMLGQPFAIATNHEDHTLMQNDDGYSIIWRSSGTDEQSLNFRSILPDGSMTPTELFTNDACEELSTASNGREQILFSCLDFGSEHTRILNRLVGSPIALSNPPSDTSAAPSSDPISVELNSDPTSTDTSDDNAAAGGTDDVNNTAGGDDDTVNAATNSEPSTSADDGTNGSDDDPANTSGSSEPDAEGGASTDRDASAAPEAQGASSRSESSCSLTNTRQRSEWQLWATALLAAAALGRQRRS